jgi:hypothetical protein
MNKWHCTLAGQPGKPRMCRVEAATWFEARAAAAAKWGTTIDRVIAIREPRP